MLNTKRTIKEISSTLHFCLRHHGPRGLTGTTLLIPNLHIDRMTVRGDLDAVT